MEAFFAVCIALLGGLAAVGTQIYQRQKKERALGRSIFISYRRRDEPAYARLIKDGLTKTFGADKIFLDVESIAYGVDFEEVVRKALNDCFAVIVVIGRNFASSAPPDSERDYFYEEVRTALAKSIPVIPVLIEGASLPRAETLPPDIRPLLTRNAFTISYTGLSFEMDRLQAAIAEHRDVARNQN